MAKKQISKQGMKRERRHDDKSDEPVGRVEFKEIVPKTPNQDRYMNAIKSFKVIFATGPAGTGKTFLATALAAKQLNDQHIKKLIITRPAVEVGEKLGYLPGELDEKFEPYLRPYKDVLYEMFGESFTEYLIKSGKIEAVPLAYLRGRTFKDCWVILDEAQNTTPVQMKMFVTRFGVNCKMIINGDLSQKDIREKSGLDDAIDKLAYIPAVKIINFTREDTVRSGLVAEFIQAYEVNNGSSS
jgi:phosphate starvation-inducible protein PhoH and related proteins